VTRSLDTERSFGRENAEEADAQDDAVIALSTTVSRHWNIARIISRTVRDASQITISSSARDRCAQSDPSDPIPGKRNEADIRSWRFLGKCLHHVVKFLSVVFVSRASFNLSLSLSFSLSLSLSLSIYIYIYILPLLIILTNSQKVSFTIVR